MKKLMTYEGLFDFLKKKKKVVKTDSDIEIINTCEDILIELGDVGYKYVVNGYKMVWDEVNNRHIRIDHNIRPNMDEVEIRLRVYIPDIYKRVLPEEEIIELLKNGSFNEQLKYYYERLSSYLSSQGFKLSHGNRDSFLGDKLSSKNFGLNDVSNLLVWIWTAKYN